MASRLDVMKNGREHFSSHIWHRRPPDRPPNISPAGGKVCPAGIFSTSEIEVLEGLVGCFRREEGRVLDRASLYLLKVKGTRKRKNSLLLFVVRFDSNFRKFY
jgi:hypothetical protein